MMMMAFKTNARRLPWLLAFFAGALAIGMGLLQ